MRTINGKHWLKVLVADGSLIASQGLVSMLSDIEGIFVVGAAQSAMQLPDLVAITRPDAVIVDADLPDGKIEGVVSLLKSMNPPPVVLVLAHYTSPIFSQRVFAAGADYCFSKTAELEQFASTLQELRINRIPTTA